MPAQAAAEPADEQALLAEVEAARALFNDGRPAEAGQAYDALRTRLAAAYRHRPQLGVPYARTLLGLAAAEYEVSAGLDAAMALLEEAETVARACAATPLMVTIRGQRGVLLLRAGRTTEAQVALDLSAADLVEADAYDQLTVLLNRGTLHMDAGRLAAAVQDLEACADLARDTGQRQLEHRARHNLGYASFLAGQIPRALADMDQAERLTSGPPHPIVLLDRARVLREAGLAWDADRLLESAAGLFEDGHLPQDVAQTRLVQAECALTRGDVARARDLAAAAEQTFASRANLQWQRRARLLVLRCDRLAGDAGPGLAVVADRAESLAAECRAAGRQDLARTAELLGLECRLRSGVAGPASIPASRPGDSLQARLQVLELRALAADRDGRPALAAAHVRRGLRELGAHQNRFGSLDLRTASAVHGLPLARLGLDLAMRSGSAGKVFAAVEQHRAFSVRLASVAPPADERSAELLAALRVVDEEVRVLGGGSAGDATATSARLAALGVRAARLQRDLRARAWQLEGGGSTAARRGPRVGQVHEVARALGTAFVTFVVHRGRWQAVVVSRARPELVDLAAEREVTELVQRVRADLDALAMSLLPEPMRTPVRGSLDAGLRRLDELLLGPLRVDGRPVVVSCSSSLVVLPWSLLPSRRGVPVVVTPGAGVWLGSAGARRRPSDRVPRVVSVAGPGLVRAEHEAAQVRDTWPGARLLVGEQATTAAVGRALSTADVVHVAGHGTHQRESPLFSSLRLRDGPLFAYELVAGTAPCVVLSACEAGLATVRPGDEGIGLARVLLHLGSRSVLAGVARVGDAATARVMARVHQRMRGGADSARALAEALAEEPEPTPFVAFGAGW